MSNLSYCQEDYDVYDDPANSIVHVNPLGCLKIAFVTKGPGPIVFIHDHPSGRSSEGILHLDFFSFN